MKKLVFFILLLCVNVVTFSQDYLTWGDWKNIKPDFVVKNSDGVDLPYKVIYEVYSRKNNKRVDLQNPFYMFYVNENDILYKNDDGFITKKYYFKRTYKVTLVNKINSNVKYSSEEKVIRVPSSVKYNIEDYLVTEIGVNAFSQCHYINEIILPNSITKIRTYAFDDCIDLRKIRLPKIVDNLGHSIFIGCKKLSTINMPTLSRNCLTPDGKNHFLLDVLNGCSAKLVSVDNSYTNRDILNFDIYYSNQRISELFADEIKQVGSANITDYIIKNNLINWNNFYPYKIIKR